MLVEWPRLFTDETHKSGNLLIGFWGSLLLIRAVRSSPNPCRVSEFRWERCLDQEQNKTHYPKPIITVSRLSLIRLKQQKHARAHLCLRDSSRGQQIAVSD